MNDDVSKGLELAKTVASARSEMLSLRGGSSAASIDHAIDRHEKAEEALRAHLQGMADKLTNAQHDHRLEVEQLRRERDDALTAARVAGAGVPDERAAFERVISASPYEKTIRRWPEGHAWPGNYVDISVDLAWCMWQARGLLAAPAAPQPARSTELERQIAIRDGEERAASEAYFKARPQLDCASNRKLFESAFYRGFDAAYPAHTGSVG